MENLPTEIHREIQVYLPPREARNYGLVIRGYHKLEASDLKRLYQNLTLEDVIRSGDFTGFKYLLEHGASLDLTLISLLISLERIKMLMVTISSSIDNAYCAVVSAIEQNNTTLAAYLINYRYYNQYHRDIFLSFSAYYGNLDLVIKLVRQHHAHAHPSYHSPTAIAVAASRGHLEVVRFLSKYASDCPNVILLAAEGGYMDIIKFILDGGGYVSDVAYERMRPQLALIGQPQAVEYLENWFRERELSYAFD